jgi:WD40 repeat protein
MTNTSPEGGVSLVAVSPDGRILASVDRDGTVKLWNPDTDRQIGTTINATNMTKNGGFSVSQVAFSPDGRILASADGDGTVKLWNPDTDRQIGTTITTTNPGFGVSGVAFSPDGRKLTSTSGGTIWTWETTWLTDPYSALCPDVGAPTASEWAQAAAGEPQPAVACQ